MKIGYEFSYLYLALKPYTGEVFAMILPYMNMECFAIFIKEFNQYLNRTTLLIADRATTHQSKVTKDTGTPANVMLGYLCKKVENELYTLWE